MNQFFLRILKMLLLAVHIYTRIYISLPWKSAASRKLFVPSLIKILEIPHAFGGNVLFPTDQDPMGNSVSRTRLIVQGTRNHCINLLFLLKPSHVQKISIIAQFFRDILQIYYWGLLLEAASVPSHTHMNELNQIDVLVYA